VRPGFEYHRVRTGGAILWARYGSDGPDERLPVTAFEGIRLLGPCDASDRALKPRCNLALRSKNSLTAHRGILLDCTVQRQLCVHKYLPPSYSGKKWVDLGWVGGGEGQVEKCVKTLRRRSDSLRNAGQYMLLFAVQRRCVGVLNATSRRPFMRCWDVISGHCCMLRRLRGPVGTLTADHADGLPPQVQGFRHHVTAACSFQICCGWKMLTPCLVYGGHVILPPL
jgi:hypothetical protein